MSLATTLRILGAVPSRGWHSTAAIHSHVGKDISLRTVQRKLGELAGKDVALPLRTRGGEKKGLAKEWAWKASHPLQASAFHEQRTLETLLVMRAAQRLLPPHLSELLQAEERGVRQRLVEKQRHPKELWWVDHVVALPTGPRRFPRPLPEGVMEAVGSAMWNRTQLEVEYRGRGKADWTKRVLHPQGLVLDGYLLYLVAVEYDYTDPVHYALLRMRNARDLKLPARILEGLNFDAYVRRAFDWPYDEPNRMEFWIHADRRIELEELPLGEDQVIDPVADEDGFHRVTVTAQASVRLDAYLESFGEDIWFPDGEE